jgi:cell division septal protein FtsQ
MFPNARSRSRRRDRESSVRLQIIIGGVLSVFILLVFTGVWYVTRLPSVTIQTITVTGGETIESSTIQNAAKEVLNGSYLRLIPYSFFFTYPHDAITSTIETIDRVESVEVKRTDRTTLEITFTEFKPYALWCMREEIPTCFFLNEKGYAFAESPQLKGGSFVRHTIEGEEELTEKQVFDEERFTKMHQYLEVLSRELNLRVTDLYYTTEGDVELRVNGGGKIYMRNDGNYDTALANIKTILTSDTFKHLKPGNFQYIDVRFGNKIFVNEAPLVDPVGTTTETVATST